MTLREVPLLDVWHALGGGALRGRRGQASWRDGDGYSVAINVAKNAWYDFVDNVGGGPLKLVETALGCDTSTALSWLEQNCNLDSRRSYSPEERSRHALLKNSASQSALDVEHWRSAFIPELNARKITAANAGDDDELERAALSCNVLENGSSEDIVREFIRQRAIDPASVARFIELGKERDVESQRITAEVVLLLAAAQLEGSERAA